MGDYTAGWANDEARAAMLRCILDIKIAGDLMPDGYFSELIHKLESRVDTLYSARKHLKHRNGSRSGVEELSSQINSLLNRLENVPNMKASFENLEQKD